MNADSNTIAPAWQSLLTLTVCAAVCAALVAGTYHWTAARIVANRDAHLAASLAPVLHGLSYDNDLLRSEQTLEQPHELPGTAPAIIYRALQGGAPVAALFVVSADAGFSGPIRLLIGVRADGTLNAVRAIEHRETPGLGDAIDIERSDWILQFDDRSIGRPDQASWQIKVDGGVFDQLTGASVTPRTIVRTVKSTLLYFADHQDQIFASPADQSSDDEPETKAAAD